MRLCSTDNWCGKLSHIASFREEKVGDQIPTFRSVHPQKKPFLMQFLVVFPHNLFCPNCSFHAFLPHLLTKSISHEGCLDFMISFVSGVFRMYENKILPNCFASTQQLHHNESCARTHVQTKFGLNFCLTDDQRNDLNESLLYVFQADPLEPGLFFLPLFYGFTVLINSFSVFYDGPESKCIWVQIVLNYSNCLQIIHCKESPALWVPCWSI